MQKDLCHDGRFSFLLAIGKSKLHETSELTARFARRLNFPLQEARNDTTAGIRVPNFLLVIKYFLKA
jgi:hypothetical protein